MRGYPGNAGGFPGLLLVRGGAISFTEIKAEGDVVRRNQLTPLHQLGNAGFTAEIGRVDFRFDPEQDYVVMDIENRGAGVRRSYCKNRRGEDPQL